MECLFLLFSVLQWAKYLQTHFTKVQQENKELKMVGDGEKQSMPALAELLPASFTRKFLSLTPVIIYFIVALSREGKRTPFHQWGYFYVYTSYMYLL